MEFVIGSDMSAVVAWWTGLSLIILSFVFIVAMLVLRVRSQAESKRGRVVARRWERALFQACSGQSVRVSRRRKLERKDVIHLLFEWNYLQESVSGSAKTGLNQFANSLGLQDRISEFLKSPFVDRRLLAINSVGNLKYVNAYPSIEELIANRDPLLSSWAWRALFRIDADATIEKHLDKIAKRRDWSPTSVAKVLREFESDKLSKSLCKLVEKYFDAGLEERQMSRLVSYLNFTNVVDHSSLVSKILNESTQKEVIIACLRLVNSNQDLERVRMLANDARWEVRLQAVITLGRLGQRKDVGLLVSLTDDPEWWVRYRAASSLITLPGMTKSKLHRLVRTLPSTFSRDILSQVMTEMELSCFSQTTSTLSR